MWTYKEYIKECATLKASHDKLKDELLRLQAVVGEEDYKSIEKVLKKAGEI